MKMSQSGVSEGYVIRSCDPGRVTVQTLDRSPAPDRDGPQVVSLELTHGAIIAGTTLIQDWGPGEAGELAREHLQPLLEMRPELVLLGTGVTLRWPDAGWVEEFHRAGIGFDVMTTGAACRTYNILSGEGRDVVVALVIG